MTEMRASSAQVKGNPILARLHAEHIERSRRINSAPARLGNGPRVRMIPNLPVPPYHGPADAHVRAYRLWIEYVRARRPDHVSAAMVIAAVTKVTGFSHDEIVGQSRKAPIALARQIAMKVYQDRAQKSFLEIGRRFGDRDHTTVLHACRKVSVMVETDPAVVELIGAINQEIDATLAAYAAFRSRVLA